jgi:hypothetical protein
MNTFNLRSVAKCFVVASSLLIASGCGSDKKTESQQSTSTSSYSYSFCSQDCAPADFTNGCPATCQSVRGGCTTGRHSYDSQAEVCSALQSNPSNNYCQPDLRAKTFKSYGCSGTFTATNN